MKLTVNLFLALELSRWCSG